jgi:hypothetical protein
MRLNFANPPIPTPLECGRCPSCGADCSIHIARKDGPYKGWRYVKCATCDPKDPAFYWLYTPEQKAAIRRDLSILLGDCDGAHTRDNVGFNRHDAEAAREYAADLEDGVDIYWNDLAHMLHKYRKTQLGGHDDY